MKYSDELAARIAEIHKVRVGTIAAWKSRGEIPEKYFLNGEVKTESLVRLSKEEEEMFIHSYLAAREHLAIHKFHALNTIRIMNFVRGNGVMYKSDFQNYFDNLSYLEKMVAPVFADNAAIADDINTLQCFLKESRVKRFSFHAHKDIVTAILQQSKRKEINTKDIYAIKETIKKIFVK